MKEFARTPIKDVVRRLTEYLHARGPDGQRRVLDLGAGDGRHTIYLAKRGFHVTAIDNSRGSIEGLEALAGKETLQITPILTDITETETMPQELYDAIICIYVVHCFSPAQVRCVGEYIKQHLKPRGYLAFATFMGKYRTLTEALRPEFSGWTIVREAKGRTQTIQLPYETIEILLQKP